MIAIVAPAADIHARRVGQELDRLGEKWVVVDLEALPGVTVRPSASAASIRVDGGATVPTRDLTVVWQRRPRPPTPSGMDREAGEFSRAEWNVVAPDVFAGVAQVSDLAAQRRATKPRQLAVAVAAGLRVPDTVITNDVDEAEAFIAGHDGLVVHKTMSASRGRFLKTVEWSESARDALREFLPHAPTIFQERVDGDDVRATVVGERIFAMRAPNAGRDDVDGRTALDVGWESADVPGDVARCLLAAMGMLGLRFGTVDLLARAGEWTFLEVNPQGQFLFQEILTGAPLCEELARYLAGFG